MQKYRFTFCCLFIEFPENRVKIEAPIQRTNFALLTNTPEVLQSHNFTETVNVPDFLTDVA